MRTICTGLIGMLIFLLATFPVAGDEAAKEADPTGAAMENWESLLHGKGLDGWTESGSPWTPGTWSREGDTVTGSITGHRRSRLTQGDTTWTDYEFSVKGTLVDGWNLQLHFRVSEDGLSFYMVDFWPGDNAAVAISMRGPDTPGVVKLNVVDFPFEYGREYDILITAQGPFLSVHIDGKLINRHTDNTYGRGGVGLNMWETTVATFRDPRIRHISEKQP